MMPRQSFDPGEMHLFRKALRARGPVEEFILTCRPDIPFFHPLMPSRFPITPHPLAKSTSVASKVSLDIIHSVLDLLSFATCSEMEPPWWIPFDPLGLSHVRFLNDLALVCRQWVIPARQAALRTVPLYLTEANVNAFVGLFSVGLNVGKYQRFVRRLYVSFPFEVEELSVDRSAALVLSILCRCPTLQGFYMDNVPRMFITRQLLVTELASFTSLTPFRFRAIGYGAKEPQDASMALSFSSPAPLYLPAMSNIENLFLAGIDLRGVNYPLDYTIFRSVRQLHLHWTRPSALFIRRLETLPSLQRLHIGFARVEKFDLKSVIIGSPSLEEVTYGLLMESSNGRMWDQDGDDDDEVLQMQNGKRIAQPSDFPYYPRSR